MGFTQTEEGIVYYAEDGTAVPVAEVPGLQAEVHGSRVLYYALPGNHYNLIDGSYAGEFKPDVTMQQADGSSTQSGAIVAVGPVASRLLSDRLAAIENPADRWLIALPVDIRGEGPEVRVGFDSFGLHGWSDTPRVVVTFPGSPPNTAMFALTHWSAAT